jgi:hypothetical protein
MRRIALFWILLSIGIPIAGGFFLVPASPAGMGGFKAIYYGARCLIQHRDPYRENEILQSYQSEGGKLPADPVVLRYFLRGMPICVNLPTALFLLTPLAMLAWGPAHMLWIFLLTGALILAAFLTWELARDYESEL